MIPLVLVLWEHPDFGGRKRLFTTDVSDLSQVAFNDTASAIGVHPGPDYASFKAANGGREPTVAVYEHSNFGGAFSILTIGSYPNIHRMLNLGDAISSVRFNPPPAIPGTIAPIPLVVELFEHPNFGGRVNTKRAPTPRYKQGVGASPRAATLPSFSRRAQGVDGYRRIKEVMRRTMQR
jgi:hypothetical protein